MVDRRTEDEYHDVAQRAANRKKLLEEEKEKVLFTYKKDNLLQYKNLEFEHDSIRDFCAEAAVFLLENAIKSGGDPCLQQIQNLISDEVIPALFPSFSHFQESKMKFGVDMEMYYELLVLLEQYKERVGSLMSRMR